MFEVRVLSSNLSLIGIHRTTMGEELGRSVLFRDSYARTWALGDRKNPSCHTPILMQLINDIEIDQTYSPFICKVDNEIPAKMEVNSKMPLSPPNFHSCRQTGRPH